MIAYIDYPVVAILLSFTIEQVFVVIRCTIHLLHLYQTIYTLHNFVPNYVLLFLFGIVLGNCTYYEKCIVPNRSGPNYFGLAGLYCTRQTIYLLCLWKCFHILRMAFALHICRQTTDRILFPCSS